jgi:phosphohistidine phosphatase
MTGLLRLRQAAWDQFVLRRFFLKSTLLLHVPLVRWSWIPAFFQALSHRCRKDHHVMKLYLVRHGAAVPLGEEAATADEDRPLSAKGLEQVRLLASGLQRVGVTPDAIVASPLRRAVQTAEELRRVLGAPKQEIDQCQELAPRRSTRKLAKYILKLDGAHLLLVGHEPDLSQHTAWLIGSKQVRLHIAKGGVACVACDAPPRKGAGMLLWLLTPEWLATGPLPLLANRGNTTG